MDSDAPENFMDLAIVIVNWNTADLLRSCLNSIEQSEHNLSVEVWVVDNASTDSSVSMVREYFPHVRLIVNDENVGFARANNQVLCQVTTRNVLLLNSDTEVKSGSLKALVDQLDNDPGLGAVGPLLLNSDGSIQPSFGRFPSLLSEFLFHSLLYLVIPAPFPYGKRVPRLQRSSYESEHDVEWITGAAMAIRREALVNVGLLDERTFMYGEDLDWCWRTRKADYRIRYSPSAKVTHRIGASARKDYSSWIQNYTHATLDFFQRRKPRTSLFIVRAFITLGALLRIPIWFLIGILFPARNEEAASRIGGYSTSLTIARSFRAELNEKC